MTVTAILRKQDLEPLVELGRTGEARQLVAARCAGALAHQALRQLALNRAEDLGEALNRPGEVPSISLRDITTKRLDQEGLQRCKVAGDLGRRSSAGTKPAKSA